MTMYLYLQMQQHLLAERAAGRGSEHIDRQRAESIALRFGLDDGRARTLEEVGKDLM